MGERLRDSIPLSQWDVENKVTEVVSREQVADIVWGSGEFSNLALSAIFFMSSTLSSEPIIFAANRMIL